MLREVIEGEMEGIISILETVENDYVCIGFVGKPRYETPTSLQKLFRLLRCRGNNTATNIRQHASRFLS